MIRFLKNIIFIIFLSVNYIYSQNKKIENMDVKNLNYSEGNKLIKDFNFKQIHYNPNDKEHIYYISTDKRFLIYFKFINDFTLYNSIDDYERAMNALSEKKTIINFDSFHDKIEERIFFLNKFLGTNISSLDKLDNLNAFDKAIKDFGIEKIDFNTLFMNFFSYYYVVIRNELNYENFEIKLHDDDYEVFVFSDEKDKREILSNFQKMITDPDEEINFHLRAKIIIKPFIISTGNRR